MINYLKKFTFNPYYQKITINPKPLKNNMSHLIDDKKFVILHLLEILRQYNSAIGSYDKSIMNSDFNYSVKLSNGRIEIVDNLVSDHEKDSSSITPERYKVAASKFVSDVQQTQQPKIQPIVEQKPTIKKNKSSLFWIVIIVVVAVAAIVFFANPNSSYKGNENSFSGNPPREKTPEELRQELLLKEQQNPNSYLKHQGTWRGNFIGKTILEGSITNSATLANFKDIVLSVTWLTKTETELQTERYTVFEYIGAGKSINYKIKADAPSATGGVRIRIDSAIPTN